ncbi:potassium transporter [Maritimibacter sp. 55A14]|uniref:monovalent cation:proton antiporter-2 (CPA2) family protein n=1 Tax=Maritimibacter sp. 55A14 TaxID=2174844 RepID=UPI000D61BA49|nr:monovalent cation:proton antiporter-2 (CPA2) family protein [Maritimibacter sp. 55A14]PWE33729.1 potassium transporter [Maritimibacter sp. 55A14]
MESFLHQSTIFLAAAVIAVPLAMRLGMGSVLGYLIAGVVIGPVVGLVGAEMTDIRHFAEFGVVLMLFLVGLELDPRSLWNMRNKLIGLGGLQILLSMGLIAGGAWYLGLPVSVSVAVGMIFALSSTAIVLQTLSEKGLMHTNGGRSSFSVLLTQDIAVIPMLALAPLLAMSELAALGRHVTAAEQGHGAGGQGAEALSLVEGLPGWGVTLVTIGAIAAVILGGHYLSRPIFHFVAAARLRELFTAVALLIVVGIAFLMTLVGLSPALGTFLAGVVLANSEFRHELEADIDPFKGLLLGLFFISVGAGIDFNVLFGDFTTILGLTLAVMAIKGGVLFVLAWLFRLKARDKWLFTLSLAQAGEFGFVLISFMTQTFVLPVELSQTLLLVVALSMLLTPLLFIAYDRIKVYFKDEKQRREADEIDEHGQVIIAGIGRFGQVVNRVVGASGYKTTVLDNDIRTVELMRRFGFKGFFGDPTRPKLLEAAGLASADVLVVALDDHEAALKLVQHARRVRPDLHIVARARDRVQVYALYRAGADEIVRETFDSSLRAGRYVLQHLGVLEPEAHQRVRAFYRADRYVLQELAKLWKPGIPVTENEAYIERARELDRELETELVSKFNNPEKAEDDEIRDEAADYPVPDTPVGRAD